MEPEPGHDPVDFSEVRGTRGEHRRRRSSDARHLYGGWLYVAASWDRPNRNLIASLFGIGVIVALLFVLIPHERVVRSRWREPFFLLWSVTNIALTTVVVSADGGSTSPLALLFFVPVVFAALSYPLGLGDRDQRPRLHRLRRRRSRGHASGSGVRRLLRLLAGLRRSPLRMARPQPGPQTLQRSPAYRARTPLTGCLNRRGFEERFDSELSRVCPGPGARSAW